LRAAETLNERLFSEWGQAKTLKVLTFQIVALEARGVAAGGPRFGVREDSLSQSLFDNSAPRLEEQERAAARGRPAGKRHPLLPGAAVVEPDAEIGLCGFGAKGQN
jgi:hypothetical protein